MSVVLNYHMPLLASTPDGIQKLRGLILELAVRGKLVPQNLDDEPASELLKRIAQEREQLEFQGKIKKARTLPPLVEGEEAFQLPNGWAWTRLADTCAVVTDGDHLPPPKADTGIPFLVIGNLNSGQVSFDGCRFVPQSYFDSLDWSRRPTLGDLLYTVTGSFGIAIPVLTNSPFCVQRHVAIFKTAPSSPAAYLLYFLKSPQAFAYADSIATGIAQRTVTLNALRQMPVAIPPAAEQHRIVTKVDELMALCDQLEAEQAEAKSAHAKLVTTLLGTLTQSTDAADFAASWQRLVEYFDTLFTTESSIDALKQTILQLAVMGKLVPQDPDDESASELLERIAKERVRLEPKEKIKKSNPIQAVKEDEQAFQLPKTWAWVRLSSIADNRLGKMLDAAKNRGELKPYLRNTNVQWWRFDLEDVKEMRLTNDDLYEFRLAKGDLLICEGGEPGRCAIWLSERDEMYFQKALHRVRPFGGCVSEYMQIVLRQSAMSGVLSSYFTGATIKHFPGDKLNSFVLPLPPVAEQHRIVAKVSELMALCDHLKADLAESLNQQARLASTLIESALEAA